MNNYSTVYRNLTYDTAVITFLKKNGDIRLMLGTRNLRTAELQYGFLGGMLSGYDNRCGIGNGNIAVIDLILGEVRTFNIERLIDIQYLGNIANLDQLNKQVEYFIKYKANYEKTQPLKLSMDTFN